MMGRRIQKGKAKLQTGTSRFHGMESNNLRNSDQGVLLVPA